MECLGNVWLTSEGTNEQLNWRLASNSKYSVLCTISFHWSQKLRLQWLHLTSPGKAPRQKTCQRNATTSGMLWRLLSPLYGSLSASAPCVFVDRRVSENYFIDALDKITSVLLSATRTFPGPQLPITVNSQIIGHMLLYTCDIGWRTDKSVKKYI